MEKIWSRFRAQYYQLVPARCLDLDAWHDLCTEDLFSLQEKLVKEVLLDESLPVPPHYQTSVLKRLVSLLGDHVSESLIEIYANLVASSKTVKGNQYTSSIPSINQMSAARYFYSPEAYIVIQENTALISAEATTGHRTWEAALALGNHILAHPGLIDGKAILELGAGTGFVSILCARLGARQVLATDGSETIVTALSRNVEANMADSTVQTQLLVFGNHEKIRQQFDVVLGADITYDEKVIPSLIETLSYLLEVNRQAIIIIASAIRRPQT